MTLKDEIISMAKANMADIVGFAPIGRFSSDDPVLCIMPETKTVICLGFGLLRGMFRGIEEGTTFYQYTTMAVENMEETVMPMAQLRVANLIEEKGYIALPERRHQTIMAEENSTNPEVAYDAIFRGITREPQMDFVNSAVKCGIGEKGFHGALLNDEFGPFLRYCFVLTDAVIEPDDVCTPHLCDGCGECAKGCPGNAIDENGKTDMWQCAVYYNGANGLKNPFMGPDAFQKISNRLEIIEGKAKVTPESARKILDNIYFYPPAQHAYQCSICGRACDVACYCHLEEKGKLKRKYTHKYREREPWSFSVDDFRMSGDNDESKSKV